MSTNVKKTELRDVSLDIIRSIAIIFVVLNHSVESYFNLEDFDTAVAINTWGQSGIMLLFTIGRMGVPLFLMLTGYLMLVRDYDKPGAIKKFWLHNLLSLVITWEIWLFLYNIFLAVHNNAPFDVAGWIRQMTFTGPLEITHYWYMPMIIGIYVFIPFIAKGIKNVPKYALYIMLAVCFAALFVVPSINVFYRAFEIDLLTLNANPIFWATYSATFMLLGHILFLRKKKLHFLVYIIEAVAFAAGLLVSVYFQIFLHANGSQYNLWYSFFTVPPMAYCLFDLLKLIPWRRYTGFIRRISICSFGIYLIHRPVQMTLEREDSFFTNMTSGIPAVGTMWLLLLFSFFISFGITEGLGQIPIVGNLLVRIRKRTPSVQKIN